MVNTEEFSEGKLTHGSSIMRQDLAPSFFSLWAGPLQLCAHRKCWSLLGTLMGKLINIVHVNSVCSQQEGSSSGNLVDNSYATPAACQACDWAEKRRQRVPRGGSCSWEAFKLRVIYVYVVGEIEREGIKERRGGKRGEDRGRRRKDRDWDKRIKEGAGEITQR